MKMKTDDGFTIEHDYAGRRITISLRGFWNDAIYAEFNAALAPHVIYHEQRGERYAMLSDLSALDVQDTGVAERFRVMIENVPVIEPVVALVIPSALLRLQVARLITQERRRIFTNRPEAEAWLDGDEVAIRLAA
jgi:hypothetical protein